MEINSQLNTFTKGLDLDSQISSLGDGSYRYAENIRFITNAEGSTGSLLNIDHIRQYTSQIPSGNTILGVTTALIEDGIECVVVLTICNNINNIYIIKDFDKINCTIDLKLSLDLGIKTKVKMISNYESTLVSKVYICDGVSQLKVINLLKDYSELETDDVNYFDTTPSCLLKPFTYVSQIDGSLQAGSVQYCYLLFEERGVESALSPISEIIPVISNSNKGDRQGVATNKGCRIKATFLNDGKFDRCRIIRIHYVSNTDLPIIDILEELKITQTGIVEFTYDDTGARSMSKLTQAELNNLIPNIFAPKTIDKLLNRLFSANLQIDDWDVEYDSTIAGGNISYKFVTTDIVLSDSEITGDSAEQYESFKLGCNQWIDKTTINYLNGEVAEVQEHASVFPHYSDPYYCAHYTGYMRDEIYRFGIVLYNNKGIPSPVHWIEDIHMPMQNGYQHEGECLAFYNAVSTPASLKSKVELVGKALGVEFTVENLPEEVKAYEIVRCPRTIADRTIVTQGLVSGLIHFDSWAPKDELTGEWDNGESDVRPMMFPNMNTRYQPGESGVSAAASSSKIFNTVKNYYEFISPEVCISPESTKPYLQNANIKGVLWELDSQRNTRVGIKQNKVYSLTTTDVVTSEPKFGEFFGEIGVTLHGEKGKEDKDGKTQSGAMLIKFYSKDLNNATPNINIKNVILGDVNIPFKTKIEDVKDKIQVIGNKTYVNTSIGGKDVFSPHGVNAVIQTEAALPNAPAINNRPKKMANGLVCNIVKNTQPYGGSNETAKLNSVYISTGAYSSDTSGNKIVVFGGDTYLCVFDYMFSAAHQDLNNELKDTYKSLFVNCYIPLETSYNVDLRYDESFSKTLTGDIIGLNLLLNLPFMSSAFAQDYKLYEYNSAYSRNANAKSFMSKGQYQVDDLQNTVRITASEVKISNEITDSWSKFKFANYIDVDTQYGKITELKQFQNRLYYFLDNAVGVASVNERSLITDNNTAKLVLGTGDVLARYDYIVVGNGSSNINYNNIATSPNALYWYDNNKNELCKIGSNGFLVLSKIKQVQSYFNTLPKEDKLNNLTFFDKKYDEVWFKIDEKTLVYSELSDTFTSFFTHNPDWNTGLSDRLVTIKDNKLYLHNIYNVTDTLSDDRISKLQYVVNQNNTNTKVYDNVMFTADLTNKSIIQDVSFKTKTQESQHINYLNIDCREDNYRFPIPRETLYFDNQNSLTMSYLGRMRGKYLICDYTFDCNNNRDFKIPYIKTTYRNSLS